jgi:hypothetical protein
MILTADCMMPTSARTSTGSRTSHSLEREKSLVAYKNCEKSASLRLIREKRFRPPSIYCTTGTTVRSLHDAGPSVSFGRTSLSLSLCIYIYEVRTTVFTMDLLTCQGDIIPNYAEGYKSAYLHKGFRFVFSTKIIALNILKNEDHGTSFGGSFCVAPKSVFLIREKYCPSTVWLGKTFSAREKGFPFCMGEKLETNRTELESSHKKSQHENSKPCLNPRVVGLWVVSTAADKKT